MQESTEETMQTASSVEKPLLPQPEHNSGAIAIAVEVTPTINYALQQNDVPIIDTLRINNLGDIALQNLTVRITTEPNFSMPWEKHLSGLGPGEEYNSGIIDLPISHDYLSQLTERVSGALHITVAQNDTVLARHSERINVLAYDEWSGAAVHPEMLAAFVMPNHPVIEAVLSDAAKLLGEWTDDTALSGYQRHDPKRVYTTAAAIFSVLQHRGIHYSEPPASFEEIGQKVRLPERMLESHLGTCLDLSLLAAACLEQAGIHPIVAIIRGHAFVGVWLVEECFANCSEDDLLRLRKRVDLDEICVFEATLLTEENQISFDRAVEEGKRHLEDPEAFLYAIDICRARKSQIRPLPLRAPGSGSPVPTQADPAEPPSVLTPTLPSLNPIEMDEATGKETPATRLDNWKRKLLDLSLRNRLLNFRETKKTLPLRCPSLAELEDALADGDKFRITPPPAEMQQPQLRDSDLYHHRTGGNLETELLREAFKAHRLCGSFSEEELSKRLLQIYRETRTSLEESGANTLYLALGFLSWREASASKIPHLAPLVLIPLEITRHSAQEGFSISQSDDDPMINTTLLQLLENDYGIRIPGLDPLPTDAHGLDLTGILRRIKQAVIACDGWEVTETAVIGNFSFTKFLMWRDLNVRAEELQKNELVAHLINTPHEAFHQEGSFPEADRLDDTHQPQETFCPLSADSSQLAAVYAAGEGKSFVLHGPPGTGKSQTITNIIAHSLASGKTVLFVSEKMAALNVVHQRLKQIGLAPFCLELHSNKAQKREVIRQLGQALDEANAQPPAAWKQEAQKLASLRGDLNEYVRALHRPQATGETVFHGLSQLIGLRDIPQVTLGWSNDKEIDQTALEHLREIAQRLGHVANECAPFTANAWLTAHCSEWSPLWRNNIEAALQQLRQAISDLEKATGSVAPLLGMGEGRWSQNDLADIFRIAKALQDSPAPPVALIANPDWESLNSSLTKWIAQGQKRDAFRQELFERYTKDLLKLDLEKLTEKLSAAETTWALPRNIGRWSVRRALRRVAKPGTQVAVESLTHDLETARTLRDTEEMLSQAGDRARSLLGQYWCDGEADWTAVLAVRDWAASLRKLAAKIAGTDLERAEALRQCWAHLVDSGQEQLQPDGPLGVLLADFMRAGERFAAAKNHLESLLALDADAAWGEPAQADFLKAAVGRLLEWMQHLDQLHAWCRWQAVRNEALSAKLEALIAAVEQDQVAPSRILTTFNRSFYQWWVEIIVSGEPALCNFLSREFEQKIRQFSEVDARYTQLAQDEIRAHLAANVPHPGQRISSSSEVGILRRELQRQRGYLPIRALFQKIPNLLPRLKPCLLMSPLSVAQYLDPAHPPFDLVVFDEASQIPVWDAVGAIARGHEAVIVGDPKQMPPTNFFTRGEDEEDTGDEDVFVTDPESILDECIAAQLQPLHLRWHYRSRHESLITFSNAKYYENRMFTFPSASQEKAISLRMVAGQYRSGSKRVNQAEAEAIVDEILRRLSAPELSKKSIGVVTFNISQQTLIEDMLEEARRAHPEIDSYFTDEQAEPIFVKNLENVQGDERDVILFSICYGPNEQGRISMNFGPLNRDGGERRLNVAITRARCEIVVFSSLHADQIDLKRTQAKGVKDLKCFLDYAERGPIALSSENTANPDGECESPFEEQVCEALRKRGYTIHPQVGCSGYRIDIGIVDPDLPGRYLLGIECDGANYHRAKTARDRDRLREEVLRGLGWQLHRVWSTDWWDKPEEELSRIEAAIAKAKEKRPSRATAPLLQASIKPLPQPERSTILKGLPLETEEQASRQISVYRPFQPVQTWNKESFTAPEQTLTIQKVIETIIKEEGPISLELTLRRVAGCWGIQKVGARVQERIEQACKKASVKRQKQGERVFLWPRTIDPQNYRDFRQPGNDKSSHRDVSDIPPEEIANAARYVLEEQISLPLADLLRETGRLLGILRITSNIEHYLTNGIRLLCQRGAASEHDGTVIICAEK